MNAPALAGFSAAWALFRWAMPKASTLSPAAVGDAAMALQVPMGGLPNGSGIEFGAPGIAAAGPEPARRQRHLGVGQRRPPRRGLAAALRDVAPDRPEDRRLMRAARLRPPGRPRGPRRPGCGRGARLPRPALLSAHLSPLARHPLLDGTGTPQPYRWVSPPPAQASTNQQPSSVTKTLDLTQAGGSGYVFTPDAQATVIMGNRTFRGCPPPTGRRASS